MSTILIKDALLVNEGQSETTDLLVKNGRIAQIGRDLSAGQAQVIDAAGLYSAYQKSW